MAGGTDSLQNLLDAGWAYHDTEPARLARELEDAAHAGVAPNLLVPFLLLSTHTIGEHLGDWPRALVLGRRALEGQACTPETARAWGRLYVAAAMAGDPVAAMDFELSYLKATANDFGTALLDMRFMLVGALVSAKRAGEAANLYCSALALTEKLGPSATLDQNIAIASNNLAWELYETLPRLADEDALMRLAAETSLTFWMKCGNWVNAERAHHLCAVVANASGDPKAGLAHADEGLAVIAANGERPLDAARLHLARAVSLGADAEARARAIGDADAAAAKLVAADLKAQYAAERAKVV
ncbi:MAG TPA: hypothetical protein VKB71_14985 [Rhizomicrobium sp.]|nr:hypothetical protein [Rhizomicrobium sp.]